MRVSLNTVKQFTDVDVSVDELVALINAQLGSVEQVVDLGERYKDAKIVKVVKCERHPNADKLSVCEIDAGTSENIQVVCGASNVREGILAVWLPPASTVPASFNDKAPFVLEPKELRGVVSNGMLASAKELGLGDSHDGILEVNPDEWNPSNVQIKPGAQFAEVYGLNDIIIDIENKMFTHRPDLFGHIGVAREIAGIQHKAFKSPSWYLNAPEFKNSEELKLDVFNDAQKKVPRFMAVAIKGVEVKPSPLWLQCALVAMGSKPINNIVDVTNYLMLLTAQPTHAYDYDTLRGNRLGTRMALKGEKAELLNGKTYELDESDIVIVDGEGIVGLGGIMGGSNSEVSADTKNIVLEVANFDMYAVRKSSMRHGVFTDALTRFNKGQSPLQNDHVLSLLMYSVFDVSPGEQASDVIDKSVVVDNPTVETTPQFINGRLGLSLTGEEMSSLLRNVEMTVDGALKVTPPFWRTDIELPEDIVEEVGRLYGFDKLPRELPKRSAKPAARNTDLTLRRAIRENLSRAGANEVLTYSFIHENTMKRAEQDPTHAYRLSNALSPDLHYYRLSLTPSLLDKVHMNIKAGYDQFALFETNKVHYKAEMDKTESGVPNEDRHVALVVAYSDKHKPSQAPYYYARKYLEQITDLENVQFSPLSEFDLTHDEWGTQLTAPYDPKRSAVIVKDNRIWGVVGEFKQSVKKSFKLPVFAAGFEIHMDSVTEPCTTYVSLPRYPKVTQDISLRVTQDTAYNAVYESVAQTIASQGDSVQTSLQPVSIYQAAGSTVKTITLRLVIASYDKTLTDTDVNAILEQAASTAADVLGAERV